MAFEYFKVSLRGLPDSILKKRGAKKILHLRVATLCGPREIEFHNGDVIRTDDWCTIAALKHYRVPKAGIKHRPKGEKEFKHVYHDHEEHKKRKVFKVTQATDTYNHEIKA